MRDELRPRCLIAARHGRRAAPAGFAENQDYGFGGNSMTEGQKSNLIFGGLFAGFVLLMSGYLLT